MNVTVVYNPKSGSARPRSEIQQFFNDAQITVDTFINITNQAEREKIHTLAKSGAVIAAIGGDGTIMNVARYVVGTPAVFAPLPGGTLNHFTKDADIEQDLAIAITNLVHSQPRKVDVAQVNNLLFLNNSSIGIYPSSLRTRARFEDAIGKWPAAVIGSVYAFLRFRLYTVTIDGKDFKTPFLFVGNNNYDMTGTAERTKLNEGLLSVYAITSTRRRDVFSLLYAAFTKQLHDHDDFLSFHTPEVTIHTKKIRKINVSTDGEISRIETPLNYRSLPGSLPII
jgi:diacylglycerol kinase family enzyme